MRASRAAVAAGALFALAALLLAWPMRRGAPYLDDYVFLTFGRHLDAPWALLLHDSVGTFFFRPVVMAIWWLSVRVLGTDGGAHLALGMVVHAANGAALAWLLVRLGLARGVAVVAGLAFVLHPTGFSAAAWLSDRFDLFAALFGLLALVAFERQVREPRGTRLAGGLLLLALALLSKEIAFAFSAAAFLLVATRVGWRSTWRLPAARAAAGGIVIVTLAALAIRPLVLRDASDMLLGEGVVVTLAKGTWHWLRYLPGFFVVRHGPAFTTAAFAIAMLAGVAMAAWTLATPNGRAGFRGYACAGSALLALLAVVAEAPVVNASPLAPYDASFTFEALAGSRFYYVPFLGLAGVLAALADAAWRGMPSRRMRVGTVATTALVLVSLAVNSRAIGREWVRMIDDRETPLRQAALQVVRGVTQPPAGCKLYFLETPADRAGFRVLLDTSVKSALPQGHPALACFIQSEHTPWYHVVRRDAAASAAPLETILYQGKPYLPLPVGNLSVVFLKSLDARAIAADPAARFFAWRAWRFEEVTADVRSGALRPRFYDNR